MKKQEDKTKKKSFRFLGYSPFMVIVAIGVLIFLMFNNNYGQVGNTNDENSPSFFTASGLVVETNKDQFNNGLVLFDFDQDDKDEIFVTGYNGTQHQVLKFSEGKLKDVSNGRFTLSNAVAAAACDIDGDGVEELFISTGNLDENSKYFDQLYHFENGNWVDIFPRSLGETNGRAVVCIDSNKDELYEFVQIDKNSKLRHIAYNTTSKTIEIIGSKSKLDTLTSGDNLLSIPILTKSGDLVIASKETGNLLFKNNDNDTYTLFTISGDYVSKTNNMGGIGYLDANQDGFFDLVFNNKFGYNKFLIQQDDSSFKNILSSPLDEPGDGTSIIVFDMDLNGVDDILILSKDKNNTFLTGLPSGYDTLPIGGLNDEQNITGGVIALINDNNRPDIVLGHQNGQITTYEGFKSENNFIGIQPKTKFDAPARGAIVKVYTEYGTQMKMLDTGSGYFSQNGTTLYFGLSNLTKIDKVEVTFTNGVTQTLTDVEINKVISVKNQ